MDVAVGEDLTWLLTMFGGLLLNSVLLTRWLNGALHRLELKIQEERTARTEYFDRKIAETITLITQANGRYWELRGDFNALELRIEQKLNGYPTKNDIRDMLAPVSSMVETIHEELLARGVRSTALHHGFRD